MSNNERFKFFIIANLYLLLNTYNPGNFTLSQLI